MDNLNIQIAKSLGYYQCDMAMKHGFKPQDSWRKPGILGIGPLPAYVNSHDAMAEAINSLTNSLTRDNFIDNLIIILLGESAQVDGSYTEYWALLTATPLQKATAYINTICPSITEQNLQDVNANSPQQSTPIPPGSANAVPSSMNTGGT